MNPPRYVLDTNIISALLRMESQVANRFADALVTEAKLYLCPMVFYEIYRGLLHRDAKGQLNTFLGYVSTLHWDDVTKEDWRAAGEHWAKLRLRGYQMADNDLLIAVFALQRQAILVTDNEKHFEALGVPMQNWRR